MDNIHYNTPPQNLRDGRLIVSFASPAIGDSITLLPIFRSTKGKNGILQTTKECQKTSVIFKNLCEIEFAEKMTHQMPNHPNGFNIHGAQALLDVLGIDDVSPIPKLVFDEWEIAWAQEILRNVTKPICFSINNSKSLDGDDANKWRYFNNLDAWNFLVDSLLKRGYTPLQFGITNNFTPLNNTVKLIDLPIRLEAAIYHVAGRFIGNDSGPMHLSIAAGAAVDILVPPDGYGYRKINWCYFPYLWTEEPCRARYHLFRDWMNILNFY